MTKPVTSQYEASGAQKIDQLTGLRFIAALSVFISHIDWNGINSALANVFREGYVGVSFFFILSGFVLSHSYGKKILLGKISLFKYFILRLARLSPLHFATTLPFIIISLYYGHFSLLKSFLNLCYLKSWVPDAKIYFSLNAPSWSLSNEIFFYLCFFPLVLWTLRKRIVLTLFLFCIVFFSALFVTWNMDKLAIYEGIVPRWLFYIFPGFRLIEFLIGMLLYDLWKKNIRLNNKWVMVSYILLFGAMYFAHFIPKSFRFSLYYIPFITFLLYAHLSESGFIFRILSSPIMVLLGNASFSFYLIHQRFIKILMELFSSYRFNHFTFFILSLLIVTLSSVLIYHSYEKRAEAFLKKWINARLI